jgi:hypothetical protein
MDPTLSTRNNNNSLSQQTLSFRQSVEVTKKTKKVKIIFLISEKSLSRRDLLGLAIKIEDNDVKNDRW